MLPILTPSFSSDNWRSLELKLIAIANKEKQELAPRDRLANNALSLAQSYARKQEWGNLFRFLIERKIIAESVSKPRKVCVPKSVRKRSTESVRGKLKSLLVEILYSDRAIGTVTIKAKLAKLGFFITDRVCQEYLSQFSKEGSIYKSSASAVKFTAYALKPTDVIEKTEWLPVSAAFKIAQSNGCKCSYYFFRVRSDASDSVKKVAKFYAQYGIEYKFDHNDRDIYRWRVIG